MKEALYRLWSLRESFVGNSIPLDVVTVRLLTMDGIPEDHMRGFVELSDPTLFTRSKTDSNVQARLDGLTNMWVEAYLHLKGEEERKNVALALFRTPNTQRCAFGSV